MHFPKKHHVPAPFLGHLGPTCGAWWLARPPMISYPFFLVNTSIRTRLKTLVVCTKSAVSNGLVSGNNRTHGKVRHLWKEGQGNVFLAGYQ